MPRAQEAVQNNRPVAAASLAGAVSVFLVALADWGLEVLEVTITVPGNVQAAFMALMVAISTLVGAWFGRIAQRATWPDRTHKAAVSLALQFEPDEWKEAVTALGMTREEALEVIGATEDEVP